MLGRLHSIETMGLVDGPGIRTVFFLQGCPLRCAFCHNPDSQTMFTSKNISSEEVLNTANRYKPYYRRSGGGVTFSGGEPLVQGEFLLETLKLLKSEGFHTAIDTSGYGQEKYFKQILQYVDVIILDIKHFDNDGYKKLTGKSMDGFNKFLSYLKDFHGTIWFRHVMVPSFTDKDDSIYRLFNSIAHLSDKIERIEVLPYHRMGLEKYENLGMEYTLRDIPEMDIGKAKYYQEIFSTLLIKEKQNKNDRRKIV